MRSALPSEAASRRPRGFLPTPDAAKSGATAWGETGSETVRWTVSRSNARPVAGRGVRRNAPAEGQAGAAVGAMPRLRHIAEIGGRTAVGTQKLAELNIW